MSSPETPIQPVAIKPYSKKDLTTLYDMSDKTMTRWLKPHLRIIGERQGRYYNLRQVKIIFHLLGPPEPTAVI